MFAQLTDDELETLSIRVYHATTRFFESATAIFSSMAQTATWIPEYDDMRARAAVLMAAGREQDQLLGEITDEARDRYAAARARRNAS
jgi:hypothetical protein